MNDQTETLNNLIRISTLYDEPKQKNTRILKEGQKSNACNGIEPVRMLSPVCTYERFEGARLHDH